MKNPISKTNTLLSIALFLVLLLKGLSLFRCPINQDEFFFLARIHEFTRGDLVSPYQNFHVLLFSWIISISSNEINQILIARMVMFGFLLGSCLLTFLIGRKFLSRAAAALSVLAYISVSYVAINGASFRADSIAIFLFLFALFILVDEQNSPFLYAICGVLLAITFLVTVKSVFYLPTLILVVCAEFLKNPNRKQKIKEFFIVFVSFAISLASGYCYFVSQLAAFDPQKTSGFFAKAGSKVIVLDLFPKREFLLFTFIHDSVFWIFLLIGALVIFFSFYLKTDKKKIWFLFPSFFHY